MLEERRRQEKVGAVRTVVGVVLLKSIRVAYTFRQCSPQRTIVSAAAGVVRCDAVHRHAFPCRAGCCLKVPPNDNPLAHPPRTLTSRSGGQETPASARQLLCVHHTINFRQPLSSPQEVPQYCMPDTLAFNPSLSPSISGLHVAAPFFEACHVSHLVRESTTHVFPPRHPLLQPGTRMPKNNARCALDAHHSGTPTPRNGFACQPRFLSRACVLNPAIRATSASWLAWSAVRPLFPSLPYLRGTHRRIEVSSCSMCCLEL